VWFSVVLVGIDVVNVMAAYQPVVRVFTQQKTTLVVLAKHGTAP
jgi:hypothetical protein